MVADFRPATSPSDSSRISALKPLRSAYLRYWRSSIEAQSCASVPPAPAWMSTKQFSGSAGLANMRRNSSVSSFSWKRSASCSMASSVASSLSASASSTSSHESARPLPNSVRVSTTSSRDFFSRPRSWACLGSFQMAGSSSSAFTTCRRSDLAS
ncbi:Uncharacterised protein [Bordetella pertussis]|nr:Uncharacterised protein [Bordetella pertussis]CFW43752.1 Uncharacterised protein [Bordetella pertussis]